MNRYIDRDELISNLGELPEQERIIYMGIYDCVRSQPTADVVEVVRCKDCKHRGSTLSVPTGVCYSCNAYNLPYCKPNDYCSYGERLDGDTDDR